MQLIERPVWRSLIKRERPPASHRTALTVVESPTAEVLDQDHRGTERATLYVLGLLVTALVAFVSLARIDRVVSTVGRLTPTAGTLTVQPLQTQIISRILVKVGDVVHKGQVLATCDPTFAQADLVNLQLQVANFDAQVRRMRAEDAGRRFVPDRSNPYDLVQSQIFGQRQAEYRAGVGNLDEQIASSEAQLAGYRQDIADYKSRLKIVGKMEAMHSELAKDGYVSMLQWLTVQDQQADLTRELGDAQSSADSTLHTLESLKEQRRAFVEKWRDDNLGSLVGARNGLDSAQQELAKAQKTSELVNLASPEDAIVTRIPVLSTGAVATGALPMFSLVPLNGPLEAQVQIESKDIGFVRIGDPVVLKFDTFHFLEHGIARGVVEAISQDSFQDDSSTWSASNMSNANNVSGSSPSTATGSDSGSPTYFFDARVSITEVQLHDVTPGFRLIPGMTLSADIQVGQRTILWYLIGGGLRTGAEAMREP